MSNTRQLSRSDYSFDVHEIAVEDVDTEERFIVGLSEAPSGRGRYIIFSVMWGFTEQDRRAGIDTYCLLLDSGEYAYDALSACVLEDQVLILRFHPAAAADLGVVDESRLRLMLDGEAIARLDAGLERIFSTAATRPGELKL